MALTDIEQILARLSTDEKLRARFVENPFAVFGAVLLPDAGMQT